MLGLFLAGVVLAAAAPAAAAAPDAPRPAAAAKPAPSANAIICRSSPIPGSRITTRTCLTAEAWRQRQIQDQRDLNDSQKGPQVMMRKM